MHNDTPLSTTRARRIVTTLLRDRPTMPLCGYAIRVTDVDEGERQCFVDALNAGDTAELAYVAIGDDGEHSARWARSTGEKREIEIIEARFATGTTERVRYRYRCSGDGIVEDPEEVEYLLPIIDGSCTYVESTPEDAPAPLTTYPELTPEGCIGIRVLELVGDADRVEMDVVNYSEGTCAWVVDGDAMFDDSFRPERALLVTDRELVIATDEAGDVSVGVQPLEPGMRLAILEPSDDVLAASSDGTYTVRLPGKGCLVVTVHFSAPDRSGAFTGLAETEPGACREV